MLHAIEWNEGKIRFLDQTRLPDEEISVETSDPIVVAEAIKRLAIRGAPLIGVAAAYGIALSFYRYSASDGSIESHLARVTNLFASTRPTAVNLFWALKRMEGVVRRHLRSPIGVLQSACLEEARAIHREDEETCDRIGRHGSEILPNAASVLTHCNTGRLATGGRGTALAVLATAWERHKLRHVYIDETRPLLQGARLTAWELQNLGIPCTLMTDSTAGFAMQRGLINAVVVGADRVAANGDVANKIGTYALAVLARHHAVPFYVAAPASTIDLHTASGKEIPIEQRSPLEITEIAGRRVAPHGIDVYSPAFDITPHELVTALITEEGVLRPPYIVSLCGLKQTLQAETNV